MPFDNGTRMFGGEEINRSTATGVPRVVVPVTTDTVTLARDDRVVWINPAGTIAALTVKLPPGPREGSIVSIGFNQIVTALTVQTDAAAAVESTAGAASVANEYRYVSGAWRRWR